MIEITDGHGRTLFAMPVPDKGVRELTIARDGEDLVTIEVNAGGELTVGHWPEDERWEGLVTYPANRA